MNIEKLEKIFKNNLKDFEDSFGFVCFFGSLNLENDLDVFIAPSKKVKKGFFMKQLLIFLEKLRNDLSKERIEMLIIWHSTYEEEVEHLNTRKNAIEIHISSFPDIHPVPIPNYLPYLKKAEKVLLGNFNAIEEMKKSKLDYFYNYLFISNCLLSNYPINLEKDKVYSKVNYIYKHLTGKKESLMGSPKEEFFKCCDFLDNFKS